MEEQAASAAKAAKDSRYSSIKEEHMGFNLTQTGLELQAAVNRAEEGGAIDQAIALKAPLDSPVLINTPITADISDGDPDGKIANKKYVDQCTANVQEQINDSLMEDKVQDAAIASVPDGAKNALVPTLKVGIEAQQDLHGYDNPWPYGATKNIGDLSDSNISSRQNETHKYSSPNAIAVTATGSYGRVGYSFPVIAGQNYTISFYGNGTGYCQVYFGSTNTWSQEYGHVQLTATSTRITRTYTMTTDTLYVGFYAAAGQAVGSVNIADFQIELGNEATSYIPSSNICPIYSHAEKNILPMTLAGIKAANTSVAWVGNTYTFNGVKWEIITDENDNVLAINASGSATSISPLFLTPAGANTFNGDILTGCPSGGGSGSYHIFVYAESLGSSNFDYGSGANITIADGASVQVLCRIAHGYAISGTLTFYPMIRSAVNPDSTFVPYRCVARVDEMGVNVWDGTGQDGVAMGATGGTYSSPSNFVTGYVKVVKDELYYLNPTIWANWVNLYDINKVFLGQRGITAGVFSPTLENVAYCRFTGTLAQKATASINHPSTDTEYHAFKDRTYFSLAKNMWDEDVALGYWSSDTGIFVGDGSRIANKTKIPVESGISYYFSSAGYNARVLYYDADENYISSTFPINNTVFKTPSNCAYVCFHLPPDYGTTYNGDIAILNAPPEIYGAELEVETGELKVTHGEVDLGDLTWTKVSGSPAFTTTISGIKTSVRLTNMLCSIYEVKENGEAFDNTWMYVIYQAGVETAVRDDRYNDAPTFTTAVTGQTVVFELATPQIFRLDPVEVRTWLAENNITCNTGKIKLLVYRCNTALYILKETEA